MKFCHELEVHGVETLRPIQLDERDMTSIRMQLDQLGVRHVSPDHEDMNLVVPW